MVFSLYCSSVLLVRLRGIAVFFNMSSTHSHHFRSLLDHGFTTGMW
jgi:hypothetical protein